MATTGGRWAGLGQKDLEQGLGKGQGWTSRVVATCQWAQGTGDLRALVPSEGRASGTQGPQRAASANTRSRALFHTMRNPGQAVDNPDTSHPAIAPQTISPWWTWGRGLSTMEAAPGPFDRELVGKTGRGRTL